MISRSPRVEWALECSTMIDIYPKNLKFGKRFYRGMNHWIQTDRADRCRYSGRNLDREGYLLNKNDYDNIDPVLPRSKWVYGK